MIKNNFDKLLYKISQKLKENKIRLGVAESFTGGLLSSAIVSIEGASDYFYEGIVCYSPLSKVLRLKVKGSTIQQFTVVSREVALEMINGLLKRDYIDLAVATTGYAGFYKGASCQGLGYLAIGDKSKSLCLKKEYEGTRNSIRQEAVYNCLEMIDDWIK